MIYIICRDTCITTFITFLLKLNLTSFRIFSTLTKMKEGPVSVHTWAFYIFPASLRSFLKITLLFFSPSVDRVPPFSYIAIDLFISSQNFSKWTIITPYYFPKCTDKGNVSECQEICAKLADTAHIFFALSDCPM